MEAPSTDWRADAWSVEEARVLAPLDLDWTILPGQVSHTFTHFHLELEVWGARLDHSPEIEGAHWCALDKLGGQALPTVMKKVVKQALSGTRAPDRPSPDRPN